MNDLFEFTKESIEACFNRCLANYQNASVEGGELDGFYSYKLSGPKGTASLEFIVGFEQKHFEFTVGPYIAYEGDFPHYPACNEFLRDLLSAVLEGNVRERRFGILCANTSNPSKVTGLVRLKCHSDFIYVKNFSTLGPIAFVGKDVAYSGYRHTGS